MPETVVELDHEFVLPIQTSALLWYMLLLFLSSINCVLASGACHAFLGMELANQTLSMILTCDN